MVAVIDVEKEVPEAIGEVDIESKYQLIVPEDAVALKVTLPGTQIVSDVVDVINGIGLIVAVKAVLG